MFEEGSLLYFEPFYFKKDAPPKNKYFLVLKKTDQGLLLASLPTSKDHLPDSYPVYSGAYEYPDKCISVYALRAGKEFATTPTKQRFSFPRDTFIYGEQIDVFPDSFFLEQIQNGKTKVSVIAILDNDVLEDLSDFVKSSSRVRGKFKKLI